jgi:hypothetical protein
MAMRTANPEPTYELVRDQLLKWTYGTRDDRTPAEELVRYYRTLPPEPAEALALACGRALTDPEPRVRAGALRFFADLDDAPDGGALREALLRHEALFRGVPDPHAPGEELYPLLLKVAAARARAEDRELVSALTRAALSPGGAGPTLAALIDLDPAWVTGHAAEIVRSTPDVLKALLWRMGWRRHDVVGLVRALAADPAVPRERLRAAVETELKGDERTRALALIEPRRS